MNYIFMDCEMGGRDLKYSLLTAAFIVTDENFNIQSRLELEIRPDDSDYIVSGQGMRVNGIDLGSHDLTAMPYKQAKPGLYDFLKKASNNGKNKLTPVGHGVKGDIRHIQDKLISEGSWEQFCTYHYIDTSVVLQFLRACGKMPKDIDGSVSALVKYFNILVDILGPTYHTAMFDAQMTMEVYKKMVELGKNN